MDRRTIEVSSVEVYEGENYMRLMRPLITEKLMKITKYETIDYPEAKIIDIDKASK